MVVAASKPESLAVRTQVVRERWTQAERLRRAIAGNRLRRAFASRYAFETFDPAVWAVGSLGVDDLGRLEGNG